MDKLNIIIYRTSPDLISVSVEEGGSGFELRRTDYGWSMRFIGGIRETINVAEVLHRNLKQAYGFGVDLLHKYYFFREVFNHA